MSFRFPQRSKQRQPGSPLPSETTKSLRDMLAFHEKILILQTLQRASGNRKRAAEILQVSRVYLWRRMRFLKIDLQLIPRGKPGRKKKVT